jgi:hypothetical protein
MGVLMRLKMIACEVLYREICAVTARSRNLVDVEFLPKGLHDLGSRPMRDRVQEVVDRVPKGKYDAILLGYALCNNGLVGVTARDAPLVLPRAHDCITLFLGSRSRYTVFFYENPGVYFRTTGWMERGENPGELSQLSIQRQTGMDSTLDEMIAKYGEENGRYLFETLCQQTHNYSEFTFIEMGVEPNDSFESQTRTDAEERGWRFSKLQGDLRLFRRLVDGPWVDDFLVVAPGQTITATYDDSIVGASDAVSEP